jgi:Zn-dependent M28 family amino/carboxypeptidase
MRSKILILGLVSTLSLATAARAQDNPAQLITKEGIRHDIEVLSADSMQGRRAGTPGEEMARNYITSRFEEIGLSSVNGSYLHEVALTGQQKIPGSSSLTLTGPNGDLAYTNEQTFTYWSTQPGEPVELDGAQLVFVGYGVEAPEHDWDDFKGEDLTGKVLLFLNDDPQVTEDGHELFEGERRTYYGRYTYKFEQAMKHGAAGAIMIHTTMSAGYPFSVIGGGGANQHWAGSYEVGLIGWMDSTTSNSIATSMGTSLEGLFAEGASRDFRPRDTGFRITARIESEFSSLSTYNVIGMLEGSDPDLKDEVVVFSGHYDHLGVRDGGDGTDQIFNGAWDNAAGTASVMNIAGAFASMETRPRRSVLFMAVAGEEGGLLGSTGFAKDPPFALNRIIADINIDMPQIFGVTRDMSAVGLNMNSLGTVLREVAAEYRDESTPDGITVVGDMRPRAGIFYRSDQVNFAKAGIPALYLNPGADYVTPLSFSTQEYRSAHYHQPSDEIREEWDLSGAERDMRVVFEVALRVLNADEMPRWNPGNEFEEEWNQLHGR